MPKQISPDKPPVVAFSVRLSGNDQVQIYEKLKAIEAKTGRSFAEVMRAILQIGIESFNSGSTIGFDGKVILATERQQHDNSPSVPHQANANTAQYVSHVRTVASKFID